MRSENFENILHKHYNEHEYERAERAVFAFNALFLLLICLSAVYIVLTRL
jgi:hypothetical protein